MYNRYIPQADGTYQRNRMQDTPKNPPPPPSTPPPPPPQAYPSPPPPPPRQGSPLGFLAQLLPKGLDFGDVAILFLLLLMAGDNEENRNNAFLTMALYCIL